MKLSNPIQQRIVNKRTKTCLYVISCNGYAKIGIANRPTQRLSEMQIGCPYELKLEKGYSLAGTDAFYVERAMKANLSERHVRGEWFLCSPEEAFKAIEDQIINSGFDLNIRFHNGISYQSKEAANAIDELSLLLED